MERTEEQKQHREQYVIVLVQATLPLQQGVVDRELTMELLIEAADLLKERLQQELDALRVEEA
jgi:hypothetical protein